MFHVHLCTHQVHIRSGDHDLSGSLTVPVDPRGLVILACACASSALDPRTHLVAGELAREGFATLLLDLLTIDELQADVWTRPFRCDVELLAVRLGDATDWAENQLSLKGSKVGYFATDICATAAVCAAARRPTQVTAIVTLAGHLDAAQAELATLQAALLLIQGGWDSAAIKHQKELLEHANTSADCEIMTVPGTASAFVEGGTLFRAADLAIQWFKTHLDGQVLAAACEPSCSKEIV